MRLLPRGGAVTRKLAAVLVLTCGCAVGKHLTAESGDLADYRDYRVAAREGTRLKRAQAYLEHHPRGAWTDEVRAAYESEEPAWFEACQASREGVRAYLTDLPRGPHADAALSLLVAYDAKVEDVETARLMRDARRTEAQLEAAAAARRAVGEAILGAVGALVADHVYGAPIDDASPLLRGLLGGGASTTWGELPARRERDLFFVLPTREGRQSRVATFAVEVERAPSGAIVAGRIEGDDLFVRWDESDLVRPLDASSSNHRSEAAYHARLLLEGALESRLPAARCAAAPAEGELVRRACDGWRAVVRWGQIEGQPDVIEVHGP
jgi:hypothetical protein